MVAKPDVTPLDEAMVTDELPARGPASVGGLFAIGPTAATLLSLPMWLGLLWFASREQHGFVAFAVGAAAMVFYAAQGLFAQDLARGQVKREVGRIQEDVRRRIAYLDASNEGFSRRYLEARLGEEIKRSQRYSLPLSVVVLRTRAGENGLESWQEATSEVIGTASRLLRTEDIFAHYGGALYAIVLPHTDRLNARGAIRRLAKGFAERSPEFGVAELRHGVDTVEGLLSAAQRNLEDERFRGLRGEVSWNDDDDEIT